MKILIATDGSEFSRAAIEECCRIAVKPKNTEIKILSVYENAYLVATEPFMVSAEYVQMIEDAGRKQAEDCVAAAERQIRECLPGASLSMETVTTSGSAERVIIEEAEKWGADLIVTGSHGRGFWGRALIGSVSSSIVRHAPCPVLVVRPQQKVSANGLA